MTFEYSNAFPVKWAFDISFISSQNSCIAVTTFSLTGKYSDNPVMV